jgi:glucokinase
MFLLFDIGGTNTRVSASYNGKTFIAPHAFKTPKKFNDGIAAIQKYAELFSKGKKIQKIVGGIAGPLTNDKRQLVNSPHLGGWTHKPLAATLEKKLKTNVYLENDTALVGLGEAVFGAGKGKSIVAYVTISTGVNGVRIVNKEIDPSAFGYEIGH